MRSLFRLVAMTATAMLAATAASGQDATAVPGNIEVEATPAGAISFRPGLQGTAPDFTNYTLGVSVRWRANRLIGAEGEAAFGFGGERTVMFQGRELVSQKMPDTATYMGNIVLNPMRHHATAPYLTGGLGVLSILTREGVEALGITTDHTLFAGNLGGGVKWYVQRGWGIRMDYRFLMVRGDPDAPTFFGRDGARYGHRLCAGIFTKL